MKKIRRTMAGRAKGFLRDWSLPRQMAGEDGMHEAAKSTTSKHAPPAP